MGYRLLLWATACAMVAGALACTDEPGLAGPRGDSGVITLPDGAVVVPPEGDGGRPSTGSTGLPCEVEEALNAVCRECHTDPARFAAPMPLLTWEDTQVPSVSDPNTPMHEMIARRLNDPNDPMPPGNFDITEKDKQALLDWVADGAPPREGACEGLPDGGPGTIIGEVGPEHLPCDVDYEFRAFDPANPSQGFPVPTPFGDDGNYYYCFYFDAPYEPGEQGIAYAPIIDDARTLHHWILYETPDPQPVGTAGPCAALPSFNAKFLTGWAPGGKNLVLPEDTGLKVTPGSQLILQIHYWNPQGYQVRDRSGVAVCTDTGREYSAEVFPVGPILGINIPARGSSAASVTCPGEAATMFGGFEILASNPHAHSIASRFRTEILRKDGTIQMLNEVNPWSFDDQTGYPMNPPVVVNPGDAVRVTCDYENPNGFPVGFGENSEQEMCFDFLLVKPLDKTPGCFAGETSFWCTDLNWFTVPGLCLTCGGCL